MGNFGQGIEGMPTRIATGQADFVDAIRNTLIDTFISIMVIITIFVITIIINIVNIIIVSISNKVIILITQGNRGILNTHNQH